MRKVRKWKSFDLLPTVCQLKISKFIQNLKIRSNKKDKIKFLKINLFIK